MWASLPCNATTSLRYHGKHLLTGILMKIKLGTAKKINPNLFHDAVYGVKSGRVKQTNWNNRILISPGKSIRKKQHFECSRGWTRVVRPGLTVQRWITISILDNFIFFSTTNFRCDGKRNLCGFQFLARTFWDLK